MMIKVLAWGTVIAGLVTVTDNLITGQWGQAAQSLSGPVWAAWYLITKHELERRYV